MMFFLLIACAFAQYTLPTECKTYNSKKTFDACNYNKHNKNAGDSPFTTGTELYEREKCTTCCRVLFVSDYNYQTKKKFTEADDIAEHTRYTMDQEFDYLQNVRSASGSYEQCILVRPLTAGKPTQYWEFAPYMMYIAFNIPKRVHDIRSSATKNNKLIIWAKKAPLADGTNNQRFVYIHPYKDSYYPEDSKNTHVYTRGKSFKSHFFVPFQKSALLCYSVVADTKNHQTWDGNSGYSFTNSQAYQVWAQTCSNDDDTQFFIPVFS